ncbi:unnamed protein product [Rotaria socialis]
MSSTLTKLKINVETFNDYLYLLGNLKSLSTLIIDVKLILFSSSRINNTNKLPELKCFSLASVHFTKLTVFLLIMRTHSTTYLDGIQLHDQILIYIPRLNKFTFSINTGVINENVENDLPSSEGIQHSLIGKEYKQVGSWIHRRSEDNLFSRWYMFDTVRNLTMADMYPFEHDLFKLVSQSFPLLKELRINNYQPQKNKQNSSIIITFHHRILVDVTDAHVDYAKQFIYDKNIHLPCLLDLCIKYESLAVATNNFTNSTKLHNCDKLKRLHIDLFVRPKTFHQYFP